MGYPPLTQCLLEALDRFPNSRAFLYKSDAEWEAISTQEFLRRVAGLSKALAALGVVSGDRVGLLSPNRPEWHIADFAITGLGAADVPIYFRESPDRLVYILNDSGARVVFVAGAEQVRLLMKCRSRLPKIEHVIAANAPQEFDEEILRYEALIASAGEVEVSDYRRRAGEVTTGQLATLIYTSGTTGEPKGVMLTHANLSSNAWDCTHAASFSPADLALSFLPLSHVYERLADYIYIFRGVPVAYLEQMDQISQALLEVRPTLIASVPRVYEKAYANVIERGHQTTGVKRTLFDWAMNVAAEAIPWRAYGEPASTLLRAKWWLADQLLFSKIRAGLGGRLRLVSSGGAPLSKELAEFFWAVGVPIYQGYGLTETSPVISSNAPGANKIGTVGQPIRNVEVRIAGDGEILVRGPCVMQGYYHKPDETRAAFTEDAWLKTGDIGRLDEDGFLAVTDRKKELLKTAAGKFVAPQPIENRLKSSPFILNAIVIGDKRKFVSLLLVPNFAAVEAKAREQGIAFHSRVELTEHPWVHDLIDHEVDRLTENLAQYEKPKRFALLPEDFTFANGELTYTLKLKRRIIEERYHQAIEQLYADVEEPRPRSRA
jgi:long-chain acyl-CoA synthetase